MPISISLETVSVAATVAAIVAGGGALYVRTSINSALDKFQVQFLEKLNGTYIRRGECGLIHGAVSEKLARIEERLDEVS